MTKLDLVEIEKGVYVLKDSSNGTKRRKKRKLNKKVSSKPLKPVKLTIFRSEITGDYRSYDLHKLGFIPSLYGEVSSKDITVIDVEGLVVALEKRSKFYHKLANKTVQVKRQYFLGKADAFDEVLANLGIEKGETERMSEKKCLGRGCPDFIECISDVNFECPRRELKRKND